MAKVSLGAVREHGELRSWLRNLFTVGACYDLWVVGMVITTLGPLVPFLMQDFGLTPAAVAVIFTARGIGYLVSVVGGGLVTDVYGRKVVVVSGALLIGTTLLVSTGGSSWHLVVALAAITGVGQGLIDGVANVIMTDMHRSNPGRALNFLHVWFGVGAFCAPLLAGWILDAGGSWTHVFWVVGVAALGLGALFVPFAYPTGAALGGTKAATQPKHSTKQDGQEGQSIPSTFQALAKFARSPMFLLMAAIMFLYNGVAGSIIGWVNTYLGALFNFSTMQASVTLSLYSAGILVGRLFMGVVVERIGYGLALLICSIGSFLSITLAVASPVSFLAAAGFAGTGLFFSGLFPTALAVGGTLFPGAMGTVSGLLVGAAALGSMVVPWFTGLLVDVMGMKLAMAANAVLLSGLAAAGIGAYTALRRRQAADA